MERNAQHARNQTAHDLHADACGVVSFDRQSAVLLGETFPKHVLVQARDVAGGPLDYFKFDSMILAIALRNKVPLITTDTKPGFVNLAKTANVALFDPATFQAAQPSLPGVKP